MSKKTTYIVGIFGTDATGVVCYRVTGTQAQIGKHLLKLVEEDRQNNPLHWASGEGPARDLLRVREDGSLYAKAEYSDYRIMYAAVPETDPVDICQRRFTKRRNYLIGIGNTGDDSIRLYRVCGIEAVIRSHIRAMIVEERSKNKGAFYDGTVTCRSIVLEPDGKTLSAFAIFSGYRIDYTAVEEEPPIEAG